MAALFAIIFVVNDKEDEKNSIYVDGVRITIDTKGGTGRGMTLEALNGIKIFRYQFQYYQHCLVMKASFVLMLIISILYIIFASLLIHGARKVI